MLKGRQFNSGDRSPDAAWPHLNTSKNDEPSAIDCEDNGIGSEQCLNDHPDSNAEESFLYSDLGFEDEHPTDILSPNMSSIASASFLQLQEQMLRIFESAQSEAAELRQRVNELEEEKLEIVRKGEEAYGTREAQLLSRIDELVHQTERLSDELVSEDEDDSQDELLQENARLVAKMDAMQIAWTQKLSTISKKRIEDGKLFIFRYYRKEIASLKDRLLAAEQSIEDHATTKALRAENAKFQQRLQGLEEHITILESREAAPSRKRKKPAKNPPASDNLRKLYVADLNSEFGKKLEEQDRIAKSQAASMEQTVSQLRQRVAELERSRSTIGTKSNQVADLALDLESACDEVFRLEAVIEEQSHTIEKQEHDLEEYRELQRQHLLSEGYETSLPDNDVKSAKQLEQNPATPSSVPDDSSEEEASSAVSADQLGSSAEVTNEFRNQHLDAEQMPGNDAIPESKLDLLKETDAGLQKEVEALRRQNQYLQEKNDLFNIQEKKWRRVFESFTNRAVDIQRKDVSARQIKKGFKTLRKVVKEVDFLEGV